MTIFGYDAYGIACLFLLVVVLCGILIFTSSFRLPREEISCDTFIGEDVPSLELNRKEFYKTLNFMLMYGIITNDQYNELTMKSLAYVKR